MNETNYKNIFQKERRKKTMMVRTIVVKVRQRQTLPFLRETSGWVSQDSSLGQQLLVFSVPVCKFRATSLSGPLNHTHTNATPP